MLDWKLLAGIFIILLVLGTALAGKFIPNLNLDDVGKILDKSPLGNFLNTPKPETENIDLSLYLNSLELNPKDKISFISDDLNINGFEGKILLDFVNDEIVLEEENTELKINSKLSGTELKNLVLDLSLDNVKFNLKDRLDANNGSIEVIEFVGDGLLSDKLQLIGKASKIDVKV